MTADQVKATVSQYLTSLAPNHRFQENEDLYRGGFVNSLDAVQLVLFLEKEYSISIPDRDRKLENFCTLNGIAAYVQRRLA
jgi:acyl carrier protein